LDIHVAAVSMVVAADHFLLLVNRHC